MRGSCLKLFLFCASFLVYNSEPLEFHPGEIFDENSELFASELNKIAYGIAANPGEVNEFCYLTVRFFNKQQTCGCFLLDRYHVVTSARCLVE